MINQTDQIKIGTAITGIDLIKTDQIKIETAITGIDQIKIETWKENASVL